MNPRGRVRQCARRTTVDAQAMVEQVGEVLRMPEGRDRAQRLLELERHAALLARNLRQWANAELATLDGGSS